LLKHHIRHKFNEVLVLGNLLQGSDPFVGTCFQLAMVFLTDTGLTSTISISGVKSTLTQVEANALMDTIIAKDVFLVNSGALVSKSDAKLTEKKVTKYDVA
jgi:hypothetical protein